MLVSSANLLFEFNTWVCYYELSIYCTNYVVPVNMLPFSAFNVPNFLSLPRDNICTYLMLFDNGRKK